MPDSLINLVVQLGRPVSAFSTLEMLSAILALPAFFTLKNVFATCPSSLILHIFMYDMFCASNHRPANSVTLPQILLHITAIILFKHQIFRMRHLNLRQSIAYNQME